MAELQTSAYSQYGRQVPEVNKGLYEEGVTRTYMRGLPERLRILVASGQHRELRNASGFPGVFLVVSFFVCSRNT